jgi:hypothetical protein
MTNRDAEQERADSTPNDPAAEAPPAVEPPAGDQHISEPHISEPHVAEPHIGAPSEDPAAEETPSRGGCRTQRQGWAGAHLHWAVRPRRRAVGRGRPPGRWC